MPFDLMAHNRALEGKPEERKPRKSWDIASGRSSAAENDADERKKQEEERRQQQQQQQQLEALRRLEALQMQNASKAKPKPAPPELTQATAPRSPQSPPKSVGRGTGEEWVCCNCSSVKGQARDSHGDCTVPADFKFCPTCGESNGGRPSEKEPPETPPTEDWDCHCGEPCSVTFLFCVECGAPALEPPPPPPPPPKECAACGEGLSDMFKFCPDCGTAESDTSGEKKTVPEAADDAVDWSCTKCGDEMPGCFNFCHECGMPRPV